MFSSIQLRPTFAQQAIDEWQEYFYEASLRRKAAAAISKGGYWSALRLVRGSVIWQRLQESTAAQKMSVVVPRLKAALEMQERPTNPSTWVADRWSIVVGYATSAISSPKRSRRLGGSEARAFTKLQQSTDNLEV